MADNQGNVLASMAGQYAPVASGIPFQPTFGFEGTMLGGHPLVGMLLQQSGIMSRSGFTPLGFNDRNVYDLLQNQRLFRMQQDVQRHMAELDREGWMANLRGIAHMTGTPWGADQMRAARSLTNIGVSMAPMLNMIAPDLVDELSGPRGSMSVMAGRMMMASRYRIDPVTGRLGQDPGQVEALTQKLYKDLYSGGSLRETQGISAGQMGLLFEQLSNRGLMSGGSSPTEAFGGGIAGKAKGIDGEGIKRTLQSYLQSVNAVRDIFGDMGRPNAPMSELIGALEALTNGSLSQIQPGRLNMMVRTTHQLATATGVGLDNAMLMQQHLSGRAAQLGLEPLFAVNANQGAMAFGAAVRNMGLPPAWGRMSADQMMQLGGQLRLNAAASFAAQRAGLALRLGDRLGDLGGDAQKYVEALRTAQDTGIDYWMDAGGHQRSLNLSQSEFTGVMTSGGKVNAGELGMMLNQKFANREFIQRYGVDAVIRRSQGRTDVQPWLGSHLRGFLQGQLIDAGVDAETARSVSASVSGDAAAKIMGISGQTFANDAERGKAMAGILEGSLGNTAAGRQLAAKLGAAGAGGFYNRTAESFYGYWSEVTRMSPDFGYLQNAQNMHGAFSSEALRTAARIEVEQRLNGELKTAVAPLSRGGSMMRRVSGYLQQLGENPDKDNSLWELISTATGGIKVADLQKELREPVAAMNAQMKKLDTLQTQFLNEADPTKKQALYRQIMEQRKTLSDRVGETMEHMGHLGLKDTGVDAEEVALAINRSKKMAGMTPATSGDAGTLYRDAVRGAGMSAGDVAYKMLMSPAAIRRFGAMGIEHARAITDANRELLQMAASHTGGDMAKLHSGEGLSPAVIARVKELTGKRDEALGYINSMMTKPGRKIPMSDAELGELQQKASRIMGLERMSDEEAGADLMKAFGLSASDGSEAVKRLGHTIKGSEAGLALAYGLKNSKAFRAKMGLGDVGPATEGGMYNDPEHINEVLLKKLATGQRDSGPTKVELPDGFKISGDLRLHGETGHLDAAKSGDNSAGVNHATTGTGGR